MRSLSRAVFGVLLAITALGTVNASSHREAPLISEDPVADNTDLYAFVDPVDPTKVVIIGNWIPFEEPAGGPSFYKFGEKVRYEIDIDNDGDGDEEIAFEFRFTTAIGNPDTFLYNVGPLAWVDDANLNVRQTYEVRRRGKGKDLRIGANMGAGGRQHLVQASVGETRALDA